ncbi:MAG: hypothetical protein LBB84_04510 [Tannerellaceae bacterium]|jgi:hypothetical protein|nr:hypothetical protein [Tannerellaceae bacterium]
MRKWTIYAAILFLATACTLEETPIKQEPSSRSSDGIPDITLKITFPTPESPITRAITGAEENKINHLYILVFHEAGTPDLLDDTYAGTFTATPEGSGADASLTDSTGGNSVDGHIKKVTLSFKTSPQRQRFVLLANLPSQLKAIIDGLDDSDIGTTTEKDIIRQLKFDASLWETAQNSPAENPFPMFGHTTEPIYIDYDHRNQIPSSIDINLIRSFARIHVGVDLNNTGNSGLGADFTINGIYICNTSDSGYVAPHEAYLNAAPQPAQIGKTNPTTVRNDGNFWVAFNPSSPGDKVERTIYVPESDSLIVNGTDSVKPAFLVIDAQYNGNQRFYRVDFTNNGKYVPLLRNHSYTINILGIKREGYATLAAAKAAPVTSVYTEILIEGGNNINYIKVDQVGDYPQYMLGLSANEVVFDWEKNWIGKPISGGNAHYTVNALSTYNNGDWSASVTPAGIFTATRHSATELRITASGENHTGEERSATVTVKAGFISQDITVRQTGGANSAVLKIPTSSATGTVRIPLAFIGKARANVFDGRSMGDFKARVIWREKDSNVAFHAELSSASGTIDGQYITVTATAASASANKYSNALLALTWTNPGGPGPVGSRDPDKIVWSWHIWSMPEIADYPYGGDVNSGYQDPNQSLLMKRVLGKGASIHRGLYYQWGRKDPFMHDFTKIEKADTLIPFHHDDIQAAIPPFEAMRLPTTFFTHSSDWINTQTDNLWYRLQGVDTLKSYYDPCPEGWRVPLYYSDPDKTPWKNDATSYLSGARDEFRNGYLAPTTAAHTSTTIGYIWTASPDMVNARYTEIITAGVTTSSTSRSSGLSVRCVKDLARKF